MMAELILGFIAGVFVGIVLTFAIGFKVIREIYRLSKLQKAVRVAEKTEADTTETKPSPYKSHTN